MPYTTPQKFCVNITAGCLAGIVRCKRPKQNHPALFELHLQAKGTYRQLLKRSRKKGAVLLKILPRNLENLLQRSAAITENRSINDEVRLGKVIHYHLLEHSGLEEGRNKKMYQGVWDAHIGDIEESPFWHSDGQTRIKQTEAFIRIFRRTISSMARNLREISELESDAEDILTGKPFEKALENFDNEVFETHIKILFGAVADHLLRDAEGNKALFQYLLKKTADLRNSIFHFKGLAELQSALREQKEEGQKQTRQKSDPALVEAFSTIWQDHRRARREKVITTLEGLGRLITSVRRISEQSSAVLMRASKGQCPCRVSTGWWRRRKTSISSFFQVISIAIILKMMLPCDVSTG